MKSNTGRLISLITVMVFLGLGLSYFWTQAFPSQPAGATIYVTTEFDTLDGDSLCSLREAILAANTDTAVSGCSAGQGADIIVLASATYSMTILGIDEDAAATGDLDITDDLAIRGQGASLTFVSGNGIDRVFHVDPTEKGIAAVFADLTIQDGEAFGEDDDVDVKGGGGILAHSEITLDRIAILNNRAQRGGGIRITSLGQAKIFDSLVKDNFADREGGGIYGDGSMDLENLQIINNEADRGGGVFCDRVCDFLDVTISQNEAPTGGGIYNDHILNLENVTIDHNGKNNGRGGGIFNQDEMSLVNVTLSSNIAGLGGSAIYSQDIAYLKNVTMYQNWSNVGGPALLNEAGAALEIVNSLIANTDGQPNCSGEFVSLGYNLSGDSTCDFSQTTDIYDQDISLGALQDNGGKTQTHALQFGSEAVDAGNNQQCPTFDQRGSSRPADGNQDDLAVCDIGAYELAPGGVLQFNPLDYMVEEDAGSVQIAVERTEGVDGIVSVSYYTWEEYTPNKANRNADYLHTLGTLTWADGDNSIKYITVPIVDEDSYEVDEIFSVRLYNPTGGAGIVEANRIATVTILENDVGWPAATPVPEPDKVFLPVLEK